MEFPLEITTSGSPAPLCIEAVSPDASGDDAPGSAYADAIPDSLRRPCDACIGAVGAFDRAPGGTYFEVATPAARGCLRPEATATLGLAATAPLPTRLWLVRSSTASGLSSPLGYAESLNGLVVLGASLIPAEMASGWPLGLSRGAEAGLFSSATFMTLQQLRKAKIIMVLSQQEDDY